MKLSLINQYTVSGMTNEDLKNALKRTKDIKKKALIEKELDSRQAVSVERPLSIEDYLG